MEISWLYCWANLIMAVLSDHLFPYLEALATFSLAVLLTFFADRREWHRIFKLALQASGMGLACLLVLHASMFPHQSLLGQAWVIVLFTMTESIGNWFMLGVTIACTGAFWISGTQIARRPDNYWSVCRRFDFGIMMFLGFWVFKMVLVYQDIQLRGQASGWMILLFIFFGLLAIGLARNQQQAQTTYMAGYRTIGVLLSFVLIVTIATISISALLWPFLVLAAETGYDLLQKGLKPVAPIVVGALTLFFRGSMKTFPESSTDDETTVGAMMPAEGGGSDLLAVLLWGIFGSVFVLCVLGITGFAIWRLVRWLFSKSPVESTPTSHSIGLLEWLMELPGFLVFIWDLLCQHVRRNTKITEVYTALLRWGHYSGVRHRDNETPNEYCLRLGHCFPDLQADVTLITDLFHRRIYEEKSLDQEQSRCAEQALKHIRSPVYWPSRLRSRILYSDE